MKPFIRIFTLPLLILIQFQEVFPQIPFPPLSHNGKISQQVGRLTLEVEYERPSARGRKIFGGLVPYGKIWRMGAGYATKLRFSHPVGIANQKIPAGTYTLFGIPNEEAWTLILNTDTTLYGAYDYAEEKDILRFEVPTHPSQRFYETFTIGIDVEPYLAEVYISWTSIQLHFNIETYTEQEVEEGIDQYLIEQDSNDPDLYVGAAGYYLWADKELERALSFVNRALELEVAESTYATKTEILIKLGHMEEALEVIQIAFDYIEARYEDPKERSSARDFFEEKRIRIEGE